MQLLANGWNILLILLGFGLLIFVHELGHFLAARWARIRCESFSIGMGPTVLAYRPGLGWALGSTDPRSVARFGKVPLEMSDAELAANGVGETEYALRAIPLGGFVRMLGQDDFDPAAVSAAPRSYQRTAIWKRMIVVSAGVIANILLAMVLFVFAFMVGVQFEAPAIGGVAPGSAAATAERVGGGEPGLRAGDRVRTIDGAPAETFNDLQVAAAMSRPDHPLLLTVERGTGPQAQLLEFRALPKRNAALGMPTLGVIPAGSTRLALPLDDSRAELAAVYERSGLTAAGIVPGSRLVSVDGRPAELASALLMASQESAGTPVEAAFELPEGGTRTILLHPVPEYQTLLPAGDPSEAPVPGLLGLTPLNQIHNVAANSPNVGILKPGDVLLRIAGVAAPGATDRATLLQSHRGATVPLEILRDGVAQTVEARVTTDGKLLVGLEIASATPIVGRTIDRVAPPEGADETKDAKAAGATKDASAATAAAPVTTPAAALQLLPLTRVRALGGTPVADWPAMRAALLAATAEAAKSGTGASVAFEGVSPTAGADAVRGTMELTPADVRALHALGWDSPLARVPFEPEMTTLTAQGSPVTALEMGMRQTRSLIAMTYLTLDRIFRGSVGAENLRGPVGIVHLGTHVADRGMMYLVFFLAIISVNLAVLNFLPLPIVDGGLFLYLVYEHFAGKPPSPRFVNAATLAGLVLIGGIFLFTFYHDVLRLFASA
ncbi:MAG: site-2 protease family protein [Phycisphaerales bacterium]